MSDHPEKTLTGRCLCGEVTYTVPFPFEGGVAHCHCAMCRRAAGSVVVTWFTVKKDAFKLTGKPLKTFKSSGHGERGNCGTCGSPVTFYNTNYPDLIDVTLATLDHPEDIPADMHIYTDSQLPWMTLDQHLPRRPGAPD